MRWGKIVFFALLSLAATSPSALAAEKAQSTDETQTTELNDILSDPADYPELDNLQAGGYLGWVQDNHVDNSCHGYYLEIPIDFMGDASGTSDNAPLTVTAGSSDYHFVGRSTFHDTVIATQPGRQIIADNAYSYRASDGQLVRINMLGHVHFREPGKLIVADTAYMPLGKETSTFDLYDLLYRISLATPEETLPQEGDEKEVKVTSRMAWGKADALHKSEPEVIEMKHATYSTCPPDDGSCAWHVYANSLVLNSGTGRGHAYNSFLWVKKLPLFYLPYFSFPINHDRQTGFLFPTMFSSSESGFGFSTPYYMNLAPNYDLTVTPYYYQKRGTQLNTQYRYLTENSHGTVELGYLPHDRKFAEFKETAETEYATAPSLNSLENSSDSRWGLHAQNDTNLSANWSASLDYNYVSDDYYTEDLAGKFTEPTSDQLLQVARLNYYHEHWNFVGLLQNYQTLHPVDEDPIYNQYARLPSLSLTADYPDQFEDMEYTFSSGFDYFYQEQNPGDSTVPTTGDRFNLRPGVSRPFLEPYSYVTPTLQLDLTAYQLSNQNQSESDDNPANPNRVVPLFDIDSGLYFQRNTSVFGGDYTQTLEPRLYYLYVPYHNQDDLPDFDTVLDTLSYDQLFQTNRFSSIDRIGDANQFSYGVTTRYLDSASGEEKVSASIGNIFYLENRKVSLCDTEDCTTRDEQEFSPVVGKLAYYLTPKWSATLDESYNAEESLFENGSANVSYHPGRNKVINVGYNYVHEGNIYTQDESDSDLVNLSQIHFSYAWPMSAQWSTLASLDFDTSYGNGASYLFGVEYSSCCWGVRTYIDRKISGVEDGQNQYDSAFYIQFVLKGLSSIGNSRSAEMIQDNVAGYEDVFSEGGV
jgi:LPS-assembly protein